MAINVENSIRRVKTFYRENSSFFDYQHELYKPPVRITEIGTSHWGPGAFYAIKDRRHFGMNLVTRGNIFFQQRTFRGYVNPGQVFLNHLNFGQSFETGDRGFATKRFILFGGELLQAHLSTTRLLEHDVITPTSPQKMHFLFRRVYQVMREKKEHFIEELMMLAQQIFMELGRSIADDYPEELSQGIAFIQRNLHRPITLDEICESMHVSVRQCVRLFNTFLNMPPIQFVHQQKHIWAENLLERSKLSIKDVAAILGYNDPFYFSNRFKKFAAISPTEFREAMHR